MPKMVRFHEVGGPEGLRIEEGPLKQPLVHEFARIHNTARPAIPASEGT
jgi:hypothetical protein